MNSKQDLFELVLGTVSLIIVINLFFILLGMFNNRIKINEGCQHHFRAEYYIFPGWRIGCYLGEDL